MKPIEKIVKALAAGSAASFRPNMSGMEDKIQGDYSALKATIEQKFAQVDANLLDIGPSSAERQQLLREQLQAVGADEDGEVLEQAQVVLDLIMVHDPKALWASEIPETPTHLA